MFSEFNTPFCVAFIIMMLREAPSLHVLLTYPHLTLLTKITVMITMIIMIITMLTMLTMITVITTMKLEPLFLPTAR